MKELEILLNRRWILKSEDKELYYRVRDAVGEIRKYVTDKLGCQIIDNSLLIKLEKIPVIPEQFMGIGQFSSKEEYVYLCILLMFLEDKDAQEQFILSQLTEYMTAVMPGEITDWTLYNNRRKLIRVLRYTVEQGMVRVTDGTDDVFMDDAGGEVLYENTGASKYFMRIFPGISWSIQNRKISGKVNGLKWTRIRRLSQKCTEYIRDCCLHRQCTGKMDPGRISSI